MRRVCALCAVILFIAGVVYAAVDPPMYLMDWGKYGSNPGQFHMPTGIAVDANGGVYVTDGYNSRVQKFDLNGNFLNSFKPEKPYIPFSFPHCIAVDQAGYVFVTDNKSHYITKFDAYGNCVAQWGGKGSAPGQFYGPVGIAAGLDGCVYIVDRGNHRIQKFDNIGVYLAEWGMEGSDAGQFVGPWGIDVDADDMVYVSDWGKIYQGLLYFDFARIQKFDGQGNFVTMWGEYGNGDGQFGAGPLGVACGLDGTIYIVDGNNYRIQMFDNSGTFLGKWGRGGDKPGDFNRPYDCALTAGGYVYVVDTHNQRVQKFGSVAAMTPVGTNVIVHLTDKEGYTYATLTFDEVVQEGMTSIAVNVVKTEDPYDYMHRNGPRNLKITTKALYTGFVNVCFHYEDMWYHGYEETLKMFRYVSHDWIESTTSLDTNANIICGQLFDVDVFGLFVPRPPFGWIDGYVTADCPAADTPLAGVTVDAFQDRYGNMVGSAITDENGYYLINILPDSGYVVTVLTPMSYQIVGSDHYHVKVNEDKPVHANFQFTCLPIESAPRSQGFWKHQVSAALTGRGNPQVDEATLCAYLDMISIHFNCNEMNPVVIYEPPSWGDCTVQLELLKNILNLWGSEEMIARARQQLMALLLNVAGGYIGLTETISRDGATVSQAITFCDNVIDDPMGNYELAKDIADLINNNKTVPEGMIPLTTVDIAYSSLQDEGDIPRKVALHQSCPNPFNPSTSIEYEVPRTMHVKLAIYDVTGRLVKLLVDEEKRADRYIAKWNGSDRYDRPVASGVYFYRLQAGQRVITRKAVLLK